LSDLPDASVDVVTTRSVLIYVQNKERAFREFWRVLGPTGRLSIFEPINRFGLPEREYVFAGRDATPVWEIAQKLRALYQRLQPPDGDPMLDFDERDLLGCAEKAGFGEIHLELRADVKPVEPRPWEEFIRVPGNPKVPSIAEAMNQVLTHEEAERFAAHLRPLVEAGTGISRMAHAYLWAVKHGPSSNEGTLSS
jgi:arsenite methyltransferase